MPPRLSPFVVGHHYRVRRDFKALRDIFVAGEELTYDYDAHSWYDGYTGYFFKQVGTAQLRAWDISDDDDLKVWKDLFEEIRRLCGLTMRCSEPGMTSRFAIIASRVPGR